MDQTRVEEGSSMEDVSGSTENRPAIEPANGTHNLETNQEESSTSAEQDVSSRGMTGSKSKKND